MTRYLGRIASTDDHVPAMPRFRDHACLADFAANGSCVRPKGHGGVHQDVNGYAWEDDAEKRV